MEKEGTTSTAGNLVSSNIERGGVNGEGTIVTNDEVRNGGEVVDELIPYESIRIPETLWVERLQDLGCQKESVVKWTYRMNRVMPFGPKENVLYYEHLSATAIDIVKNINLQKKEGIGWKRFPKNVSDVKFSILKVLINLRKYDDVSKTYELEQERVLGLLETQYGLGVSAQTVEDNDKLRLYGLLFLPHNFSKLCRLVRGVGSRQDMDDPERSIKGAFEEIAHEFNNELLSVVIPAKASDVEGIINGDMDANELSRIRIKRDGKWCEKVYRTVLAEYKAMLHKWYKGTGGGSGNSVMFEEWSDEKKDKYDVIVEQYDHADVNGRPSILIDNYSKKKYLTIIFLWDEEKDYILGSKYNPFSIGIGEAGVIDVEDGTEVSQLTGRSSPEKSKVKMSPAEEASALVASVFSLVNEKKDAVKDDKSIEGQSLPELMKLHEMYLANFNFKKDNGMMTDEVKIGMMNKMERIFEIIEERSAGKKRTLDDIDNSSNNVS